jgi:hypothetical protein
VAMARVEQLEREARRGGCPFIGEREGGGAAGLGQAEGRERSRGTGVAGGRP